MSVNREIQVIIKLQGLVWLLIICCMPEKANSDPSSQLKKSTVQAYGRHMKPKLNECSPVTSNTHTTTATTLQPSEVIHPSPILFRFYSTSLIGSTASSKPSHKSQLKLIQAV